MRAGERRRSCRQRRLCAGGTRRQDPEARLCQPADRAARGLCRGRQFRDLEFHQRHAGRPQDRQRQLPDRGRGQGQPVQSQSRRRRGARADRRQQDRPDAGRIDPGDHQSGVHHVRGRGRPLRLHPGALAALFHRTAAEPGQSFLLEAVQLHLPLLLGARGRHRGVHQHVGAARDQQIGRRPVSQRRRRQRLGRQAGGISAGARASSATSSPIPAAIRTSATISPPRSPRSSATTARS